MEVPQEAPQQGQQEGGDIMSSVAQLGEALTGMTEAFQQSKQPQAQAAAQHFAIALEHFNTGVQALQGGAPEGVAPDADANAGGNPNAVPAR